MHLSIFDVVELEAKSSQTLGAPLSLHVKSSDGTRYELTLFLENQVRCDRLVTAINAAFDPTNWTPQSFKDETNVTRLPMTLSELGQ